MRKKINFFFIKLRKFVQLENAMRFDYFPTRNSKMHSWNNDDDHQCVLLLVLWFCYKFSVYLLHYIYIVIVITVLVTTFCAIAMHAVDSVCKWVTDRKRNFWFVAKKVKVCMIIYSKMPIRVTRTCKSTKWQKGRKMGRERRNTLYL